MKNFIAKTLITAAGVVLASYVLHTGVTIDRFSTALLVALVLSALNFFVRPQKPFNENDNHTMPNGWVTLVFSTSPIPSPQPISYMVMA